MGPPTINTQSEQTLEPARTARVLLLVVKCKVQGRDILYPLIGLPIEQILVESTCVKCLELEEE